MSESTLDTLSQRLDRLERENRWWKIIGSAAVVLLCVLSLLGATHTRVIEEIRAKRFVLVDKNSKIRAKLELEDKDETTTFKFYDKSGIGKATISVKGDGALISVFEVSQQALDRITTKTDEIISLPLEKRRKGFQELEEMKKKSIGNHAFLLVTRSTARLGIEEGGELRASIASVAGLSNLTLYGDNQNTRAVLGSIELVETRTDVEVKRPVSSLVLFDKDGKVIWKAP